MISTVLYSPQLNRPDWVVWSRPKRAYYYIGDQEINLLSGNVKSEGPQRLEFHLSRHSLGKDPVWPTVFHLSYEWGNTYQGLALPTTLPLGLMIEYSGQHRQSLPPPTITYSDLKLIEAPSWPQYQRSFQQVYEHLLKGDTYQVNLTSRFRWKLLTAMKSKQNFWDLFSFPARLGAFAHATLVSPLDLAIISNSPECLVQRSERDRTQLHALPIKGTLALAHQALSSQQLLEQFQRLKNDPKNRSELFMILDLLRNDLSSLGYPRARITRAQKPLVVSGLLHQYGIVKKRIDYSEAMDWGKIMRRLFPGGSITGAPKKRTMEIIAQVESSPRGFYCGSSLVLAKKLAKATINIRTVSWEGDVLSYGSGGGITLLSQVEQEYQEMSAKVASYFDQLEQIADVCGEEKPMIV